MELTSGGYDTAKVQAILHFPYEEKMYVTCKRKRTRKMVCLNLRNTFENSHTRPCKAKSSVKKKQYESQISQVLFPFHLKLS